MTVGWGHYLACALVACATLVLAAPAAAPAASLQQVGDYSAPVFVTSDPANPDRIFVVEQDGRIQLTSGGVTSQFLDIDSVVRSAGESGAGDEQGLLSMAFAPDYPTSGRFYVFYTGTDAGALHVDELTASGNSADPATLQHVITIAHAANLNHNGGQLQFGPDGYLYVSTGDGGGIGDPGENAQDLDSLLGKILRIDPNAGGGYDVPADNPYVGIAGADEIWSYGLRNPWRFSFDRLTGDLWIGDVGQANWEEIDLAPAVLDGGSGYNFGWDCREGRHDFETTGCSGLHFTEPVFEYPNGPGLAAVAGGYVMRDPGVCELYGRYVYADTYAGVVRSLAPGFPDAADDRSEGLAVSNPVSFGEDSAARMYLASLSGPVYRIVHTPGAPCSGSGAPAPEPEQGTGDLTGPGLRMDAKQRQSIRRRERLSVEVVADEAGTATIGAEATVGKKDRPLFALGGEFVDVQAGVPTKVKLELDRRAARRSRRAIEGGKRVEVLIGGAATDAAGNRGPAAVVEVRLVL